MIIDRRKLSLRLSEEKKIFRQSHPKSAELFKQAQTNLFAGVPMNWMLRWASDYPVFIDRGEGAYIFDVDGNKYLDFCLGDTGAMTGHAPKETIDYIKERIGNGTTFMLPNEDALWVSKNLSERFGLPYWQFVLSATDANRFVLRLARHITGRHKVLIFNWSYHGTVDETFVTLQTEGNLVPRRGSYGPPVDPAITTKVVEFNDVEALQKALADQTVACVLAEPAMTNIGIIHPQPGFHEQLRKITRETGTLLIIDETHTISAGPGGYTKEFGLEPDFITLGKPIGSGIPGAVYGMSADVADRLWQQRAGDYEDVSGVGGTLAGNVLSIAAMRATLEHILTEQNFAHTIALAKQFEQEVYEVIDEFQLPWIVKRLGCRVEYWFRSIPPQNGTEAASAIDAELDRYMHLAALNRGILMTPFHNMALIAPQTKTDDIAFHTTVFRESIQKLMD